MSTKVDYDAERVYPFENQNKMRFYLDIFFPVTARNNYIIYLNQTENALLIFMLCLSYIFIHKHAY